MGEPLYQSAIKTIVMRIAEGVYPPGSMLPSEFDLGAELNVSQGTARKALTELELKGVIERRQGKGSFVTLRTPENSLFHFFRLRTDKGEQVAPQLVAETVTSRRANAKEKTLLVGQPDTVFEIVRVRNHQGAPLCHEVSIVPTALFPGLKERSPLPNALYVVYQHAYSCVIIRAEENLKAGLLADNHARAIGAKPGIPVIIAERRAFDVLDRLVELRTSVMITQDTSYSVELD